MDIFSKINMVHVHKGILFSYKKENILSLGDEIDWTRDY